MFMIVLLFFSSCLLFHTNSSLFVFFFFFFNDTATTEIYTLSLHDALPNSRPWSCIFFQIEKKCLGRPRDRKSTRLNSSHVENSYAVFCLKKKNTKYKN